MNQMLFEPFPPLFSVDRHAFYSKTPIAATTPAAKPISGRNLAPAPGLADGEAAAVAVSDGAAVLDAAAEEVEAGACLTSFASSVPHAGSLHFSAPGLALLQRAKVSSQASWGTVPRYWSSLSGCLPSEQVQFQTRVFCVETSVVFD